MRGGSEVTTCFRISHYPRMQVPTVVQGQKMGFPNDLYYVSHTVIWYLIQDTCNILYHYKRTCMCFF